MYEVTLWVLKDPINSEATTEVSTIIVADTGEEAIEKAKSFCPYSVWDSLATKIK